MKLAAALLLVCSAFAQSVEPAHLVFYRNTGGHGSLNHARIKIDSEKAVYKLSNNHVWRTQIAPGEHVVSSDVSGPSRAFESGKTYFFRVDRVGHGFRCILVDQEMASEEMIGLKEER